MDSLAPNEETDYSNRKYDFISELAQRNCDHILHQILQHLSPISLIKASKVNLEWENIIRNSSLFPLQLDQTFQHYHQLNPYPVKHLLGDHLSSYNIQSHKLYPGGDVKIILVENQSLFIGLASGLTKRYDLTNFDNFKYPASRFYDPDNGKGVTHLSKNDTFLATGHGDMVLIWNLDSASIVSESVTLDSQYDFIGHMVLAQTNKLIMLTRFNARLRIYDDLFHNRSGEYILDVVPKKVSLSSQALVFSYQHQDDHSNFPTFKLTVYRILTGQVEFKTFDMQREISWIFQDFPLLFLGFGFENNIIANQHKKKQLELWNVDTVTRLYSVALDNIHLSFLELKNWIYWSYIGQGKGQLTYGSVMDLLDQNFQEQRLVEDDSDDEQWNLNHLSGSVVVLSKKANVEMKIFGLNFIDDGSDDDELYSLM